MSWRIYAQVWELDLPGEQQQVMLALADHAHDDGSHSYPGIKYLAWKVGKSESAVTRILTRLRESGVLRDVAYLHGGRGHATEYMMCLDKARKKPAFVRECDRNPRVDADLYDTYPRVDAPLSMEETPAPAQQTPAFTTETPAPVHVNPSAGAPPTIINHQRTIKEPGTGASAPPSAPKEESDLVLVREIFAHYKLRIQPRARLPADAEIRARLRRFSPQEIMLAIDHFSASAWAMERNNDKGAAWFFSKDQRIEHYVLMRPDQERANATTGRNGSRRAGGQGGQGVYRAGNQAGSAGRGGASGNSDELRDALAHAGIRAKPASPN